MAGDAGFKGTIEVSEDDGGGDPYVAVGGINSVNHPRSMGELDVTEFGDTAVDREAGLADSSVSISGFRDFADPGQIKIKARFEARLELFFRIRPDGVTGFVFQTKIFGITDSATPAGTADYAVEASSIADWADTP